MNIDTSMMNGMPRRTQPLTRVFLPSIFDIPVSVSASSMVRFAKWPKSEFGHVLCTRLLTNAFSRRKQAGSPWCLEALQQQTTCRGDHIVKHTYLAIGLSFALVSWSCADTPGAD